MLEAHSNRWRFGAVTVTVTLFLLGVVRVMGDTCLAAIEIFYC